MSTNDSLTVISGDIYGVRDTFASVLSDPSINFERESGFAIQVLAGNAYAMRTALANRQSVVDAVVNIAAIGISLNPAKKQAYLVPRDGRICLDISYMGLMDLAQQSGAVVWAQAALVHESDTFALNGLDKPPTHTHNPFSKDRGPVVGVYCTVKLRGGDYLTHTMSYDDCIAIRNRSSAWKAFESKNARSPGPWGTDEGEMIKKTCVKQAYKYWPRTAQLENAIHHLNEENGEGLASIQEDRESGLVIPAVPVVKMERSRSQVIEAVASAVVDHFNNDDVVGAYEEYSGISEEEEKLALWKKLPSNVRSAIKKHGASLQETN